jgi:hypothetical protein
VRKIFYLIGGGNLPQSMALAVSAATNRLAGADYTYDVLGNLVTMPAGDGAGTVSIGCSQWMFATEG